MGGSKKYTAPKGMRAWIVTVVLLAVVVLSRSTALEGWAKFDNDKKWTEKDLKKCKKKAGKHTWYTYDFRPRTDTAGRRAGDWVCHDGWKDTGCQWGMGAAYEHKQCRRKHTDTPLGNIKRLTATLQNTASGL